MVLKPHPILLLAGAPATLYIKEAEGVLLIACGVVQTQSGFLVVLVLFCKYQYQIENDCSCPVVVTIINCRDYDSQALGLSYCCWPSLLFCQPLMYEADTCRVRTLSDVLKLGQQTRLLFAM